MMKLFINSGNLLRLLNKGKSVKYYFTLIGLLLLFCTSYAQFPVQVTPQLVGPYTVYLSDYYTGTNPKIYVTVTNADLARPILNVRLRMSIKGQTVTMRSRDNVNYPTISLLAGIPQRLSLNDLAPYFNPNNLDFQGISRAQFQQQGKLPEGFYEFCFEAVEITTGLTVSKNECAIAAISLSDPPFLNLPASSSVVEHFEPTNILFTWTPRHLSSPNSAYSTVYDFQLVELRDPNVSPDVALRTTQPLYQTTTSTTVLLYGPSQPQLIPGKKYGWRVKARNTNGVTEQDIFRNGGYSEVFWFTYLEICHEPTNLNSTIQTNGDVTLNWQPLLKTVEYIVKYKNNSDPNSNWITQSVTTPFVTIPNLARGDVYQYQIGNRCKINGDISFSTIKNFTIPALPFNPDQAHAKITWVYKQTEEAIDPSADLLVSKTRLPESVVTNPTNNINGTVKYPLKDAYVSIYGYVQSASIFGYYFGAYNSLKLLGTGLTDAGGTYRVAINESFARRAQNTYIEVTHASGLFNKLTKNVSLVKTAQGYTLSDESLAAQSFELKPSVYIPNYISGEEVSVDILLLENTWNGLRFMESAGLGSVTNRVMYNGQQYIVLTNLTTGKAFKKLFYNAQSFQNYLIRVNYKNRPSIFVPMNAVLNNSDNAGQKPVILIKKTLEYIIKTKVEGVITFNNLPRRDVRVKLVVNPADIVGDNVSTTVFIATSDASGNYANYNLPPLRVGATVQMTLTDNTIRTAPFYNSAVYTDSNLIRKNINLVNNMYTVTGRLVDQDGVPQANALVTIDSSSQQTRTSPQGFYLIKVFGTEPSTIKFLVDGYDPQIVNFTPGAGLNQVTGVNPMSETQWKTAVEQTAQLKAYMLAKSIPEATAELLGIGTGDLITRYSTYFNTTDNLRGVIDLGSKVVTIRKGKLAIQVKLNGQQIRANIKLSNDDEGNILANQMYQTNLPAGHYSFEITPVDGDAPFLTFFGETDVLVNQTTTIYIALTSGFRVTGTVKDAVSAKLLDSATVSITGLPYEAETDSNGVYVIVVPKNEEIEFVITRPGYNTGDSTFIVTGSKTINFTLIQRDPNLPNIETLAGFPITLDKQMSVGNDNYVISGKLTVAENDIFSPDSTNNELTFKNIMVKALSGATNATPTADVAFEEATIESTAFGFAPVEIEGYPQITMRGLKNTAGVITYDHTVIGGAEITLALSGVPNVAGKIPVSFPDATITSNDTAIHNQDSIREENGLSKFAYLYSAPDYKLNALNANQSYTINFEEDEDAPTTELMAAGLPPADSLHFRTSIGYIINFYIEKATATLDGDGIGLNGYMQFPKIIGAKLPDSGRVEIEKFQIGTAFEIAELTFLVSKSRPLIAKVQKIQAEITKISLFGLGTPNYGIGLGGIVTLKKSSGNQDSLIINSLSLIKTPDGTTLSGSISFAKGISIKSLVFTTPGNSAVALSYNFTKKSFVIEVSGVLNYNSARSTSAAAENGGATSGLGSVFPVEIQQFKFSSKDWSFFMVAKANIKIDLKVVKVNIEKFLVSVGAGLTMDQMNVYLQDTTGSPVNTATGGPDDQLEEATASWAVGIKGGIEFPIKDFQTSIKGSLLIGNINNSIEVRLNELELGIKTPSFELLAKVKIQFSGTKQGFEGEAKMKTLSKEFEATFKYYKISASPGVAAGFELGASLKVSAAITTGPLLWHMIGGGFNFNTSTQEYLVFLTGDVGTAATPKEVMYVKDAYISVLFQPLVCGAIPVIEGSGELWLQNKKWASLAVKADFCKMLFLVTVKATVEVNPGITVYVDGVLFGMKRTVNGVSKGALFLGVNANIQTLGDIVKGNIFLALGLEYDNADPNSPQEVKNMWTRVGSEVKDNNGTYLHGLYLSGTISVPGKSGGFNVSIGGFPLFGFNYDFGGSGSAIIYVKFATGIFKVAATMEAHANANLTVFGSTLYGSGFINLTLNGGYDGKWYVNGSANIGMQLYNSPGAGCNSVSVVWRSCCCTSIPYPCGMKRWFKIRWCHKDVCIPYPDYSFKVCKSIGASFSYRQGQATTVSLNLF